MLYIHILQSISVFLVNKWACFSQKAIEWGGESKVEQICPRNVTLSADNISAFSAVLQRSKFRLRHIISSVYFTRILPTLPFFVCYFTMVFSVVRMTTATSTWPSSTWSAPSWWLRRQRLPGHVVSNLHLVWVTWVCKLNENSKWRFGN